ncbi:MAG: DUF488 domain-containing protein [bacterium]
MTLTIWTIGHSTRTTTEFRDVLESQAIELVADVRRFPGSRRLPHFDRRALAADLLASGVFYQWLPALGGRRVPSAGSENDGWRHPAFRGYADHLLTEEFADGLTELLILAHGLRTVIMCAELLWWRCHRRLIADVLVTLGIEVIHIRDAMLTEEHRLTAPARLIHGSLSYAGTTETIACSATRTRLASDGLLSANQ